MPSDKISPEITLTRRGSVIALLDVMGVNVTIAVSGDRADVLSFLLRELQK